MKKKITVKAWQLALVALLALLIPVTAITLAKPKPAIPHPQEHKTQSDFWDAIRMKPVKVLSYDGHTLQYQFEDTSRIDLGSFEIDGYTTAPAGIKEGKKYIVIYCETHKVAYQVVPMK